MRFGKMFAWQFAMSVFVVLTNKAMAISSDDHHLDHARSCYPVLDEAKFGGSSRFTSRKSEVRPTSKSESAHLHPNETLENVDSLDKLPTLEGSRVLSVSPLERASLTDYHTFVHVSKDVIDAKHFKTAALSEIQPASSLSKFEPRMLSPIQINSRDGTSVHEVLQTSSGDKSLLLFVSKPGIQNGRINFMPLIMNKEATSSELSSYPLKWPRHLVQPLPNDPSAVNYFAISQNTVAYFNRSTHTFQIWNIHNGESLLSQVESFLQNTVLEFYDDIRSLHFRALALSPSGRRAVLISKQYAFIFDFQTGRVDFVHSKSEFKIPPST
ncbi:MAG TPA: hypothetical protein PLU50_09905, partial [Pseudobdellovibrionaceae bacterium]|nr:hypothetical protein [Pseudobdellovibrionaceae bacterium]